MFAAHGLSFNGLGVARSQTQWPTPCAIVSSHEEQMMR